MFKISCCILLNKTKVLDQARDDKRWPWHVLHLFPVSCHLLYIHWKKLGWDEIKRRKDLLFIRIVTLCAINRQKEEDYVDKSSLLCCSARYLAVKSEASVSTSFPLSDVSSCLGSSPSEKIVGLRGKLALLLKQFYRMDLQILMPAWFVDGLRIAARSEMLKIWESRASVKCFLTILFSVFLHAVWENNTLSHQSSPVLTRDPGEYQDAGLEAWRQGLQVWLAKCKESGKKRDIRTLADWS